MGDTINWGFFKRHFWGELLRYQQAVQVRSEAATCGPVRVLKNAHGLSLTSEITVDSLLSAFGPDPSRHPV